MFRSLSKNYLVFLISKHKQTTFFIKVAPQSTKAFNSFWKLTSSLGRLSDKADRTIYSLFFYPIPLNVTVTSKGLDNFWIHLYGFNFFHSPHRLDLPWGPGTLSLPLLPAGRHKKGKVFHQAPKRPKTKGCEVLTSKCLFYSTRHEIAASLWYNTVSIATTSTVSTYSKCAQRNRSCTTAVLASRYQESHLSVLSSAGLHFFTNNIVKFGLAIICNCCEAFDWHKQCTIEFPKQNRAWYLRAFFTRVTHRTPDTWIPLFTIQWICKNTSHTHHTATQRRKASCD